MAENKNLGFKFLSMKFSKKSIVTKKIIFKFINLMIFIAFTAPSHATPEEKTIIYGHALKNRLEENGNTQYNNFFTKIKNKKINFDLKIKPLSRSIRNFKKNEKSCLFPTSKNLVEKIIPNSIPNGVIESTPLDLISLHIFTNKNFKKIESLEELEGKTVAIWGGLDPQILLQGINVKIETTADEEVRLKMLKAKRIDAILGFKPDIQLTVDALGYEQPHYSEELNIYKDEPASIVCHKNKNTESLIKKINESISKMKKSGELKEILGRHAKISN